MGFHLLVETPNGFLLHARRIIIIGSSTRYVYNFFLSLSCSLTQREEAAVSAGASFAAPATTSGKQSADAVDASATNPAVFPTLGRRTPSKNEAPGPRVSRAITLDARPTAEPALPTPLAVVARMAQ